jgi:hypothetical protein
MDSYHGGPLDPLDVVDWHRGLPDRRRRRRPGFIAGLLLGILVTLLATALAPAVSRGAAQVGIPNPVAPTLPAVGPGLLPEASLGHAGASPDPAAASQPVAATPVVSPGDGRPTSTLGPILEPDLSTPAARAVVEQPTAEVITRNRQTPPNLGDHRLAGEASWGDDWTGVVTRLPRGTAICVAGKLGHWCGLSIGYGPAIWTGRIVDFDRATFHDVRGDPVVLGTCQVVLSW